MGRRPEPREQAVADQAGQDGARDERVGARGEELVVHERHERDIDRQQRREAAGGQGLAPQDEQHEPHQQRGLDHEAREARRQDTRRCRSSASWPPTSSRTGSRTP